MSTSTSTNVEAFSRFNGIAGELTAYACDAYQTSVYAWSPEQGYSDESTKLAAIYGYVVDGEAELQLGRSSMRLVAGQYFAASANCRVTGGHGFAVRHENFKPLTMIGGPIEETGRLRYISGCTDTLLVPPPRLGDPCLNALYFPPNTDQQPHTHPSIRVGVVASGRGVAVLPDGTQPLNAGDIFMIAPDGVHSFRTEQNQPMTVIAYHPDSDYGPRDDDHPMINRTIIS